MRSSRCEEERWTHWDGRRRRGEPAREIQDFHAMNCA